MKGGAVPRSFLAFVLLLLVLLASLAALTAARRPSSVVLLFTGDTQGFLVPCGCKTVPAGGLARRAGLLKALEEREKPSPVVPVEIGHGFADRGPAREILNRTLGRFYRKTGTLVGLGSYDLLLGPEALRRAAPGVPFHLAGREPLRGSREIPLGGWGVRSWGRPAGRLRIVFLSESEPEGVPLRPPLEVLEEELSRGSREGILVTGQLSTETVVGILKDHPEVLAVVAQWGSQVTSTPQRVGGSWVVWVGDRGRRAATVTVARTPRGWEVLPRVDYLGPEIPEDPSVAAEVAETLRQVEAENRGALERLTHPAPPGGSYVGAASCAPCHGKAHEAWRKSRHARATEDLAVDHQTENPDCLRCHATGVGKAGGYPAPEVNLAGVQCEACHGPAAGHPPRRLAVPPLKSACSSCHTRRDSPLFEPSAYWLLVKHGAE